MAENKTERRGLKMTELALLVVVGIVGVLIAFWVLSFIAGVIWWIVKMAILVLLVAGVLYLLLGRRRK